MKNGKIDGGGGEKNNEKKTKRIRKAKEKNGCK
jgi:hypothetical protein